MRDCVRHRARRKVSRGSRWIQRVRVAHVKPGEAVVAGQVLAEQDLELDRVNRLLTKSITEVNEAKQRIEEKNHGLQRLATRDPLTGCLNRRAFFEQIEPLFVAARDQGTPLCCVMTDIDHFKTFNDRHGHAIGDQVLQAVSRNLAGALRGDIESRGGPSIRSTQGLKVTSSFGVAVLGAGALEPAQLIDRADQALYLAKRSGRNCVKTMREDAAAA